ncbi:MAG: DNA-binding protein [Peptococcaceae bacterium]|nr:MAG: DNA-binding protein [Peptococcaceae bacterium]
MEEEILTKAELAKLLKVTQRTIDRLRTEGLPCFKVGNAVRFNRKKVLKWFEEQEKNKPKN